MDNLRDIFGHAGPLFVTFLLGFVVILLFIWHSCRKQTYWKNLGVPYVKPYPLMGTILEALSKPFHDVEVGWYRKYGRIYGHFEGNKPLLSVAEPEILRSIFVKDFHVFPAAREFITDDKIADNMLSFMRGEDWKRVRNIVTPTFTTGKIKRMLGIFKDCSRTLLNNFRQAAEKGDPIEVKSNYGAFTMDVIACSAFSTKIDSHNDPENEFVKAAKNIFTPWRIILIILFPWLQRFLRLSFFSSSVMEFFSDATLQIMEERKRTGQTRNDFLQLLMDTAKEVSEDGKLNVSEKDDDLAENYGKDESDIVFKYITSKKNLSFEELVAQCVVFFTAGYVTTTTTLAFTTYLLAINPDVQEELIQELDNILRNNKGEMTYEAVQNMKYLDNVISESLRLYPPAFRLERAAVEDYKLADTGIVIRKGDIVTIPVYAMHRDPKNFPDPDTFYPNRWLPEERAKRHPYCYLPFGAGPRNCIGMRFALMEMKVCLAHVLSNFRIKKCSKTKVPLDFGRGEVLLQPKEVHVIFEIRNDNIKAL